MPTDLLSIADPRLILVAWAAGLALVAGVVSLSRIVGPGFSWLMSGSAALIGLPGVLADGAWWARLGLFLLLVGALWARNRAFAGLVFVFAGVAYLVEAALFGGWVSAVTACLALGGVSGEMLLGHWYLVDPRLPRQALRRLAVVGIVGLAADPKDLAVDRRVPPVALAVRAEVADVPRLVLLAVGQVGDRVIPDVDPRQIGQ